MVGALPRCRDTAAPPSRRAAPRTISAGVSRCVISASGGGGAVHRRATDAAARVDRQRRERDRQRLAGRVAHAAQETHAERRAPRPVDCRGGVGVAEIGERALSSSPGAGVPRQRLHGEAPASARACRSTASRAAPSAAAYWAAKVCASDAGRADEFAVAQIARLP